MSAKKTEAAESRTLSDYLFHLKLRQAEVLLGPEGRKLIREGGKSRLTVTLPDSAALDRLAEVLGRLVAPVGGN